MVRFDKPAFAELYRTRPLGIRPRTAYYLWFELTALCDGWGMALDGQQFFVRALVDTLPRVAQLHADAEFIQRLVEAARDLRDRVATATFPDRRLATCTAQEFIVHIALDRLEDDLAEMRDVIHFDGFHKVFPKTRFDDDVGLYRDALLDDCDVELLFDPALDGVESDPLFLLQLNPVHLHSSEWFLSFAPGED